MKRVYLDANIVIYFVEQHPRFSPCCCNTCSMPTAQSK